MGSVELLLVVKSSNINALRAERSQPSNVIDYERGNATLLGRFMTGDGGSPVDGKQTGGQYRSVIWVFIDGDIYYLRSRRPR